MNEILTIDEMKSRYESEWVLVGEPEVDESLEVLRGRVLFHSPDSREMYAKAVELRPGRFATLYTGEVPEDMEFAL